MSTNQTIELPQKIVEALSSIGYQVIPPPVASSPCEDCAGQGYDPKAPGYQTCQTCQGWRMVRWRAVVGLFPEKSS